MLEGMLTCLTEEQVINSTRQNQGSNQVKHKTGKLMNIPDYQADGVDVVPNRWMVCRPT